MFVTVYRVCKYLCEPMPKFYLILENLDNYEIKVSLNIYIIHSRCLQHIQENTINVIQNPDLMSLSHEALCAILNSDTLEIQDMNWSCTDLPSIGRTLTLKILIHQMKIIFQILKLKFYQTILISELHLMEMQTGQFLLMIKEI